MGVFLCEKAASALLTTTKRLASLLVPDDRSRRRRILDCDAKTNGRGAICRIHRGIDSMQGAMQTEDWCDCEPRKILRRETYFPQATALTTAVHL